MVLQITYPVQHGCHVHTHDTCMTYHCPHGPVTLSAQKSLVLQLPLKPQLRHLDLKFSGAFSGPSTLVIPMLGSVDAICTVQHGGPYLFHPSFRAWSFA